MVTIGNRLCIWATAWIATLTTLGLRQNSIDLIDDRIRLNFEANRSKSEDGSKIAASTASAMIAIRIVLIVYFTKPVKPIKASDIKPAVIIAIEAPLKGSGTSAAAIRSRIEANRINTIEKPTAAPKP